jgi:hypothetical protein
MWTSRPKFALVPAIAILCLAAGAACGGGGEGSPTASPAAPTPLASPTPTATVTPEVIDGVEVVPLQFGEEAELPGGAAVIVETGCTQCDGPTTALVRVYRDAAGQVRTDTLFSPEAAGLPPRLVSDPKAEPTGMREEEPYITGFALDGGAAEIVVGVCSRGYCGGLGWASADAQTTLFRSLDGGVTWAEFGVLEGGYYVVAITKDGVLLSGQQESDPAQQAPPGYQLFPSGDPLEPPPEAGEGWPISHSSGELIWRSKDGRLLRSDGSEFLTLRQGVSFAIAGADIEPDPSGKRLAVALWREGAGQPSGQSYFGIVSLGGELTEIFSAPEYASVGGWINSAVLAGNANISAEQLKTPVPDPFVGYLPALFDLDAREIHPIPRPFLDPPFRNGRNRIQAVLRGPFARVVNTGACLNVRAAPGMAADVLACAADDVLLRDTAETQEVDGTTWRRVVTPAGLEGWASSQYLER